MLSLMKHSEAQKIIETVVCKLKAERERQGLSLKGLGVLSGLDRTFIGRIERGERSPTLLNCLRLADALKLRLGDVINSAMRRES